MQHEPPMEPTEDWGSNCFRACPGAAGAAGYLGAGQLREMDFCSFYLVLLAEDKFVLHLVMCRSTQYDWSLDVICQTLKSTFRSRRFVNNSSFPSGLCSWKWILSRLWVVGCGDGRVPSLRHCQPPHLPKKSNRVDVLLAYS